MNPFPLFWAVIPAAGVGARMQADRPKQYLEVAGRTVLEHTLDCFLTHPRLRKVVVSVAADDPYWPLLSCAAHPSVVRARGGQERADSVLNGLNQLVALGANAEDWVLVHDAARPNVARSDVDNLLATLAADAVGGLLAIPVRDTLKKVNAEGRVQATLDRRPVWQAYTPQMFRLGVLREALTAALAAGIAVTDEASAIEAFGLAPRVVEGRADNLKITRPEDLDWLRHQWAQREG